MEEIKHYPVMYREVIDQLSLSGKKLVVDCTVGMGTHSQKILEAMPADGMLIGIDKDEESLNIARERLRNFNGRFNLVKSDFSHLDEVVASLGVGKVDGFLFDLGISTYQLSNPERGFSFLREGPLDMRMDREAYLSAADLIGTLSEGELSDIFYKFGEERYSRRIAAAVVAKRKAQPIATTTGLAQLVAASVPAKMRHGRIHPATRIFQALRIAVNRELDIIESSIRKAVDLLNANGRIAVISFHSLEDRIVKFTFKDLAARGIIDLAVKKPLVPGDLELSENNASRSAKLRVAIKR
jgi:16S rRNA (cytosine1402-N4)-methyltransferase